MKKNVLILCSLLIINSVYAQNIFPPTGNSGIGTINPQANLDIYRAYDANQLKTLKMFYSGSWGHNYYATDFRFLDIESSEGGKILQLNGYGMGIGYNPPAYLSPDKLYVNGNVGIGTYAPKNLLSLGTSANQGLLLTDLNNNDRGAVIYDGSQSLLIQALSGPGGSDQPTMKFQTADITGLAQTQMVIMRDGDVGIGTTDPKGYRLAVNGKIRAQEIKVEASPWPDYVFAKSYQLPSLQETEEHIKAKGHLLGIPSAEEVKVNGIDLGDMNAKLLQKIEELTLHLIEVKKENNQDKADIHELKQQLQQQEAKINLLVNKLNNHN